MNSTEYNAARQTRSKEAVIVPSKPPEFKKKDDDAERISIGWIKYCVAAIRYLEWRNSEWAFALALKLSFGY